MPGLAQFIQSALNNTAHNDHSEVEMLLQMSHEKLSVANPDWDAIVAAAANEQGPCSKYASILASVAKQTPVECVHDLSEFWKAFQTSEATSSRFMGSEFLARLASLSFGKADRFPWVVNSCMKANMLSKDTKLVDGFCRLLTTSNLTSLTSLANRPNVAKMEKVMSLARAICTRANLEPSVTTLMVGRLDTRLVLHQCKLGKWADKTFGDDWLDAVGQACILAHA